MRELHSVVFRRRPPAGLQPARRRLRLVAASASTLALLAAGCGNLTPPAPLATSVHGPVLTVVTAQGLDPFGVPKKVTPYFVAGSRNHGCQAPPSIPRLAVTTAADHRLKTACNSVLAVALVGRLSGPTPLVMTWLRETSNGPQVMFRQQVIVTSNGMAFTTAVTAGTIPFGTYHVVASIGKSARMATWTVYPPGDLTPASFAVSQRPMTAGPSGAFPVHAPVPEPCSHFQSIVSMPSTDNLRINVSAYCPPTRVGGPVRGAELATMNRDAGLYLLGRLHLQPGGLLTGSFLLDVCKLPDASDLPGATIYLSSIVYYHGGTRNNAVAFGLPPEHAQPTVTLTSNIPSGTLVHPGEHIVLRVTGTEPRALGAQEGIRYLGLSGPGGVIAGRNFTSKITACDRARLHKKITVRYTVPANAPRILTLTAVASDTGSGGNTTTIIFPVAG